VEWWTGDQLDKSNGNGQDGNVHDGITTTFIKPFSIHQPPFDLRIDLPNRRLITNIEWVLTNPELYATFSLSFLFFPYFILVSGEKSL